MEMDDSKFWADHLNWQPTAGQLQQLECLYQLVLQGNQHQNLTRITHREAFWEKHLWDSLRGVQSIDPLAPCSPIQRVIDIGTGAGFPGIPLAIAYPQWQLTCIDSTQRKIQFVQSVVAELGLSQVKTAAARVEVWAHHEWQQYDLAVSRALAPAVVCVEYSIPLLKVGGRAILYRGQWTRVEAEAVQQAAQIVGGEITQVDAFQTPLSQGIRHCVIIQKIKPTPDSYPRAIGIPSRHPLAVLNSKPLTQSP